MFLLILLMSSNEEKYKLSFDILFIGGTPMSLRYRKKLAGDQPKDLNAKTFAPKAGNIRPKKINLKF